MPLRYNDGERHYIAETSYWDKVITIQLKGQTIFIDEEDFGDLIQSLTKQKAEYERDVAPLFQARDLFDIP